MSDDKSDKVGGWFANPLPIVMVVVLAAGLLVKYAPLESARPTDPERVKSLPTSQQDVEARLWQDPFAAVATYEKSTDQHARPEEKIFMVLPSPRTPKAQRTRKTHEQCSDQAITPEEETSPTSHLPEALCKNIKKRQDKDIAVTIVAVSASGGSYSEASESRRRSRFAVGSALDFHHYHPENADALGYFHIYLPKSKSEPNPTKLVVPYEWFVKGDKSRNVLVLWLNDDNLTSEPLTNLRTLFDKLTPSEFAISGKGLRAKLIGPAGSAMFRDLIRESTDPNQNPIRLKNGSPLEVYSPIATISNCNLLEPEDNGRGLSSWDCFKNPSPLLGNNTLPIVRTTGTDDVLATALLWELWQRGVNRTQVDKHQCTDGLVLIGERDTEYGRTLLGYLRDGFSDRCRATTPLPIRTFTYLRGLDGVLPDIDKSSSKAPPKDDSGKAKDLRAQLEEAPPEHAEGRSQFDYLRRLADEIDRLDQDENFAENSVRAIGIVGSDIYDKLLILQALRSRFKDKIFFTTDLDARYLHADQKDWARNLVVASNFGLSLHPELQRSTMPFRDSYQTATYLATLMALKDPPLDWTKKMKDWLRPQIFEIGRTEAVHLASPSADDLTKWIDRKNSDGNASSAENKECGVDVKGAVDWTQCANIEPDRIPWSLLREHPWAISFMVCFGLLLFTLANRHINEMLRTACSAPSPERKRAWAMIVRVIAVVFAVAIILWWVHDRMNDSFARGVGEPFLWFEGISVWPSLVIRSVGLLTMLGLWYAFLKMIQQQEKPDMDFEIALPKPRKLNRSKLSAWLNGPHLNLALFDREGYAEARSAVKEETTGKKIIDVITLWQNYLRATSWREMAGWIMVSLLIGLILIIATFKVLDSKPSFPHRGVLVANLHQILVPFNALVLWLSIFWVGYEARACTGFIDTLSNARSLWSPALVDRETVSTGVPRAHLDDYLDFKLIVHATQRIRWLIYLPFVGILFMVLSRSNFFDAMDFPLALVFVVGLALAYALYSAWLLRRSAESARGKAIEHYERQMLIQARVKDSQPPILIVDPISVEQIKLLLERIRNNREGAFAPFAQQPALQALLLPFGGYGSIQIIEYLFKF